MNKKTKYIIFAVVLLVVFLGTIFVCSIPKQSQLEFEAVVKETVTQTNGEIRLIVERTTEIYGDPTNALCINQNTKLLDENGKEITINNIEKDMLVKVSLKDAFTEETPFYYPIVYEIQIIES